MKLTKREKTLITYGLFILENQCFNDGEDLHYEIKEELEKRGGVPNPSNDDEIRDLMDKIEEILDL